MESGSLGSSLVCDWAAVTTESDTAESAGTVSAADSDATVPEVTVSGDAVSDVAVSVDTAASAASTASAGAAFSEDSAASGTLVSASLSAASASAGDTVSASTAASMGMAASDETASSESSSAAPAAESAANPSAVVVFCGGNVCDAAAFSSPTRLRTVAALIAAVGSPARRSRMSSTDMSATSGSCLTVSKAYPNRSGTTNVSLTGCSTRMKSTGTSPNCRRIGEVGSRKSTFGGRRMRSPLPRTTYDPLVEPRSRTVPPPF